MGWWQRSAGGSLWFHFALSSYPVALINTQCPQLCERGVFLFQRYRQGDVWGPDHCHVNVHVNEFEVSDSCLSVSCLFYLFSAVKTAGQIQGLSVSLPHPVSPPLRIQEPRLTDPDYIYIYGFALNMQKVSADTDQSN